MTRNHSQRALKTSIKSLKLRRHSLRATQGLYYSIKHLIWLEKQQYVLNKQNISESAALQVRHMLWGQLS